MNTTRAAHDSHSRSPLLALGLVLALSAGLPACVVDVVDEPGSDDVAASGANDAPADDEVVGEAAQAASLRTHGVPSLLKIDASAASNSGTTNDLKLSYQNANGTYSCIITGGLATGQSTSCTPTWYDGSTSGGYDKFGVGYSGGSKTDGLRIDKITAVVDGESYSRSKFGAFTKYDAAVTGCVTTYSQQSGWYLESCNTFWVDGDDHGSYKDITITLEGETGWFQNETLL